MRTDGSSGSFNDMAPRVGGPVFRRAVPADALTLSVLATQVFLDTYATRGIGTDLAREATSVYARAVFEARLADSNVEIIVATAADHLLGFVDIAVVSACPVTEVTGAEVFRLYVQRPFLRQGMGRSLIQAAEQVARRHDQPALWLTAWAGNTNALGFYKALGYDDVGAAEYVIEGQAYENRVLRKRLAGTAA